jgi:hypothetical protein
VRQCVAELEGQRSFHPIDRRPARAELYVLLTKRLLPLRLKPDWKAVELELTGATQMELDDVEIQKYRCDYKGAQYFATVVSKDSKDVCVTLGVIVNKDGDIAKAAVLGAQMRFRAVMMTSIAFIFGLVPLVTAQGAAEISRRAVGTPVFAGMIGASVVGIFVIPMLYVTFQTMREWRPKGRASAFKDHA